MNKAITDGLELMPPPFSAGLSQWSREDGTPGSGSYAGQPNAAYVPADQDFGGCLELQKLETVQKLRYSGETPFLPGMYLRVTARIKAVAGNLPAVRIAAWAGRANGTNVSVDQIGPSVTLTSYGAVVTVSAIIGSGNRGGVDMVWGTAPVYGHFGLDLTGSTGGVVRIDDIVIEDVTEAFLRDLMDVVDVRDFGAVGDGTTDDSAAFQAADDAAAGRVVLVSKGNYRLNSNVTFENAVRFEGTVTMPSAARLACTRNYNLDTYAAAFGSEQEGFRRGMQALFYFSDHVTFDLSGRRVDLTAPVNVASLAGLDSFAVRRGVTNGQLNAVASSAWDNDTVTSIATYTTNDPSRLTAVADVANIAVGARVVGTGVGREVYVKSKNIGAGTVTLSRPLWAAAGTRSYTFRRYQYILDLSGFDALSRFEITDIEFNCGGLASAIMLPTDGSMNRVADSVINRPKDRGITSTGTGCQGMFIEQCRFLSDEQSLPLSDRTSIALNINGNDVKLRDCLAARFAHFAIMAGTAHQVVGNHFYQGDDEVNGVRQAGVVFTAPNPISVVSHNYIDNCSIEVSNEHDPTPEFSNEYTFGGLTITSNVFYCSNVTAAFRFIVVRPRGQDHYLSGLIVTGNVFRAVSATIDRVEKVDTSNATLDFSKARNVVFSGNTFNGVTQWTVNPVTIEHVQNTAADTWSVDGSNFLPFGGWARNVQGVVAEGSITTAGGSARHDLPYVLVEQGSGKDRIHLRWPVDVKGKAQVTLRVDNPN